MELAATIVMDGLIYASWLFVVALGMTLVFGVLKILNIAHGSLYAVGAYAAATAVGLFASLGLAPAFSLLAMLLAAIAVALLLGPALERGLLRLFYGRDEVVLLLVTYALFLILEDAVKLVWGVNPYYVSEPYQLFGNVTIGPLFYVGYDLALIGLAMPVFGLDADLVGQLHLGEKVIDVMIDVGVVPVTVRLVMELPGAERKAPHQPGHGHLVAEGPVVAEDGGSGEAQAFAGK